MNNPISASGLGWLRVPGSASATAWYRFDVRPSGPAATDAPVAHGTIRSELLVEAMAAGAATLVLRDGQLLPVRLTALSGGEGAFRSTGKVRSG